MQTVTVGRDYLTEREVERLFEAAKDNRHGHRDATAILFAYRHGLRGQAGRSALGRCRACRLAACMSGGPRVGLSRPSDQRPGKPGAERSAAGRPGALPYVFVSERGAWNG